MLDNVYNLLKDQKRNQSRQRLLMGQLWNPISRDYLRRELDRVQKKMINDGISFAHITPHTFRHTFASRGFEKGIPPKVMQKILGHNDLATTMDTYTHVLLDTKAAEIQKLVALFS